jgi:hypothetical protein
LSVATIDAPTNWRATHLEQSSDWVFQLNDHERAALVSAVKSAHSPDRALFDYSRDDFDIEPAWQTLSSAFAMAQRGRGIALIRGLPRDQLDEAEFALLSWAIGLHAGCARPQGKMSQYMSEVRDASVDYRASTGRGYSSNAELDFHVDGADLATLACFNDALEGGQSMISSSVSAWNIMLDEHPALAEELLAPACFSRQAEEAHDERPWYAQPVADFADGRLCLKWNRNRVMSAQRLDGVPPLGVAQREAMETLDGVLRRPEQMYTMYLQPGDMQIFNNREVIHSRTRFIDHEAPEQKRLLHRLWLAPPDSGALPQSWLAFYRSTKPGAIRGGIRGHHFDANCQAFDARQAATHGMAIDDTPDGP